MTFRQGDGEVIEINLSIPYTMTLTPASIHISPIPSLMIFNHLLHDCDENEPL
jgi:hypothetical protein